MADLIAKSGETKAEEKFQSAQTSPAADTSGEAKASGLPERIRSTFQPKFHPIHEKHHLNKITFPHDMLPSDMKATMEKEERKELRRQRLRYGSQA